jgi:hypothetical protein
MFRVVRQATAGPTVTAVAGATALVSLALALAGCSNLSANAGEGTAADAAPTAAIANVAATAPATPTQRLTATGLAARLTTTRVSLPARLGYLQPGYNNLPEWTRVDVATAPDGTAWAAWPAADGIHVTPLNTAGARKANDIVIKGTTEVSGLVAFNNGFTLLTRVPDQNKWHETAAALISYRNGKRVFETRLTSAATDDTAPVLDGALAWNGQEYGAYFVVHGAGGPADGHFGDKLVYVSAAGRIRGGGWPWGCSHNEGVALSPGPTGKFPSLCLDDWRSGLFVSTGIGAPDNAPVLQRE